MSPWTKILQPRHDVVVRHVAGECLLIPIRGKLADMERIFALDPVGEHIWMRLDGRSDVEAVLRSVRGAFTVTEDQARKDVLEFVASLEAAGLVEEAAGQQGKC